jgi:N-acetylmuramoyl-L-alanine amidase
MTYTLRESKSSKNFTPYDQVKAVFGVPRVVKGITIHHWGALGQKFTDVENFLCTNNTPTSAHYIAEGGLVSCIVSPDDAAWHAGNGVANAETIGIECRPEGDELTYQTVAELIAFLRNIYGDVPLYPHSHWHATACPGKWDLAKLDRMARAVAAKPAVAPQSSTITKATTTTKPTTVPGGKMLVISQAKGDPKIWIGDGITRRHIPDPKTLADYQKLAQWGVLNIFKNGQIMDYPLEVLGQPVAG